MRIERVPVDAIQLGKRLRQPDEAAIAALVESMKLLGQLQPISIHSPDDATALLVTGYHRLEAAKRLEWDSIDAVFVTGDEISLEMQEIAENLHRSELTALERSNQIARWAELTAAKVGQLDQPLGGAQPAEKGISKVSRELHLDRKDVERAVKVASISDEAKQAAREAGIDDNRSALLAVAKEAPASQVAKVAEIAAMKASTSRSTDSDTQIILQRPSDSNEAAALANALRVGLSALDPVIDRIHEIGAPEFWRLIEPTGRGLAETLDGLWRLEAIRKRGAPYLQ